MIGRPSFSSDGDQEVTENPFKTRNKIPMGDAEREKEKTHSEEKETLSEESQQKITSISTKEDKRSKLPTNETEKSQDSVSDSQTTKRKSADSSSSPSSSSSSDDNEGYSGIVSFGDFWSRKTNDDEKTPTNSKKKRKTLWDSDSDSDSDSNSNSVKPIPKMKNFQFYSNEIPSRPNGDCIETIHKDWWGNYGLLESHHGFIQWLFPLPEGNGVNGCAQKLYPEEIEKIRQDPIIKQRFLKSYELILDFYGLKIKDQETGELEKTDSCEQRFENLEYSTHNNLRITRILKSCKEFGFEKYVVPFIECFLKLMIEENKFKNQISSMLEYWIPTIPAEQLKPFQEEFEKSGNKQKLEEKLKFRRKKWSWDD